MNNIIKYSNMIHLIHKLGLGMIKPSCGGAPQTRDKNIRNKFK